MSEMTLSIIHDGRLGLAPQLKVTACAGVPEGHLLQSRGQTHTVPFAAWWRWQPTACFMIAGGPPPRVASAEEHLSANPHLRGDISAHLPSFSVPYFAEQQSCPAVSENRHGSRQVQNGPCL